MGLIKAIGRVWKSQIREEESRGLGAWAAVILAINIELSSRI